MASVQTSPETASSSLTPGTPRVTAPGAQRDDRLAWRVSQPNHGVALLDEPEQPVRPAQRQRRRPVGEQDRIRQLKGRSADTAIRSPPTALMTSRCSSKCRATNRSRSSSSAGVADADPTQQTHWLKKSESVICIPTSPSVYRTSPPTPRSARADPAGERHRLLTGRDRQNGGRDATASSGTYRSQAKQPTTRGRRCLSRVR